MACDSCLVCGDDTSTKMKDCGKRPIRGIYALFRRAIHAIVCLLDGEW